jgi:hypothetical protein
MDPFVTPSAQGDQVLFRVVTEPAAGLNVMYLEFSHRSAMLAAPPVSLEYSLPQFAMRHGIKPRPGRLEPGRFMQSFVFDPRILAV